MGTAASSEGTFDDDAAKAAAAATVTASPPAENAPEESAFDARDDGGDDDDDYVIIGDHLSIWFQSTLCQRAAHGISTRDVTVLEDPATLRRIHAAQEGRCISCDQSLLSIDEDLLGMHNR